MSRRSVGSFSIGGTVVARGEARNVALVVSQNALGLPVSLPVRVIRGDKSGPRVYAMGAVHGDELNGTGIIRDLMLRDLRLRRGTLVLVPVVNVFGFERNSRYLPDRRDLNRSFPGDPNGSLALRLASSVFREIVAKCDYGLDFHSAAQGRSNYPHVRADLELPEVRRLAEWFGCEICVDRKGDEQCLRRAATYHGCPTITFEAGEALRVQRSLVELGVRCTLNVLRHLEMIDGAPQEPTERITVRRTQWVRSHAGGLLRMQVQPGAIVEAGATLGVCDGFFDRRSPALPAPTSGFVLAVTTLPVVRPGAPICNLAVPDDDKDLVRWQAELARKGVGSAPPDLHGRSHAG